MLAEPSPTVVVVAGDGIGPIVIEQALRVLEAVGFRAGYVEAAAGRASWLETGEALPARTVDLVSEHRLCLFGAITSAPRRILEEEAVRLDLPAFVGPITGLRRHFDLDVSVRPARSFAGNPANHVRRSASGEIMEPIIDIVVFRQNTEGLYAGLEWSNPPLALRSALEDQAAFAPFVQIAGEDLALGLRVVTRSRTRRLVEKAFTHARTHGYGSVTVCEKPNVLTETSGLFVEVAAEVAGSFPNIEYRQVNVDSFMLDLLWRPEEVGVVATSNLLGDIVSEAAAGLVGGLGFAPSANLGLETAVFEPAHGSAPDIAGSSPPIANPIAAILAAAMLVDQAGEPRLSGSIREAIARVVQSGQVRTADMLGPPGTADAPASTVQMADAIIAALP